MDVLQHNQFAAVIVVVFGKLSGELYRLDGIGIDILETSYDLEVLLPDVFRHTSDAGSVIGRTQFGLFAVAADVESFEVDENLLAFGQVAVHAILVDGNE